jgi:hypothetical protein
MIEPENKLQERLFSIHREGGGAICEEIAQLNNLQVHCCTLCGIEAVSCSRFEVFTAVNMKNGVFSDINTQFVPNRRHVTPLLQSPIS